MGGGPLRREAVLIVDDDESTRAAIAAILGDAGYVTREADCGEEALRAVRVEPPALLLLDVNLPGICGYEVWRLLRDEFGEQFPIVFVSGARTESFDRVAGLLLGANDYVAKPFAEDELLARVQSLLSHRHAAAARALASRLTRRELQAAAQRWACACRHRAPHDDQPEDRRVALERIYMKLGVQTRAQAVAVACRDQLLETRAPSIQEQSVTLAR